MTWSTVQRCPRSGLWNLINNYWLWNHLTMCDSSLGFSVISLMPFSSFLFLTAESKREHFLMCSHINFSSYTTTLYKPSNSWIKMQTGLVFHWVFLRFVWGKETLIPIQDTMHNIITLDENIIRTRLVSECPHWFIDDASSWMCGKVIWLSLSTQHLVDLIPSGHAAHATECCWQNEMVLSFSKTSLAQCPTLFGNHSRPAGLVCLASVS